MLCSYCEKTLRPINAIYNKKLEQFLCEDCELELNQQENAQNEDDTEC